MLESIIHGGQKVAHSRIAVRCRAWILSWRRKENHSFHLDSPGLFGSQEESLKHQLCIYFYIQVFVLHLLSLSFFFRALLCLQRLLVSNCLCVLTVPAIMLWHTLTHRHTQGCLPHHPSQTDTGPAWHLNSTEGTALGSINMHDSIIGYAQTMHIYPCVCILHTCAGGINAHSHCSVHPNLLAYTHTLLQPLLDHPIWRLEATLKTKHLQRLSGGESDMEGGKGGVGGCCWKRRGEHANGAKGMKEGERGGRNLWCVMMPQLPIWFFRHLFTLIGRSVLSSVDSAVSSLPPNNGPITGWKCHCLTALNTLGCLFPLKLHGCVEVPFMGLL